MPQSSSDVEVFRSLQRLLRVRAANDIRKPEVIISAAPQVWADTDLGDSLLINVSRILGVSSSWTVGSLRRAESQLEEIVYQQFLDAGWPSDLLRSEYRPDNRSGIRFDIALLSERGEPLMAVEVARMGSGREAAARQILETTKVPFVCVCNGETFVVHDRDGASISYQQPPPPSRFNIRIPGEPRRRTGQAEIRPDNADTLRAVIEEHAPRRVVFDYTLPLRHRLDANSTVRQLLPRPLTNAIHRNLESSDVLLAWAASFPSVEFISTITTPALAWAGAFEWLRAWLTKHMRLAAHIELPPGAFGTTSIIRASYFLFDRAAKSIYFDSLSNRGDLVDLDNRPWYESYVGWLSGRPPERGFERSSTHISNWTPAQNDPQADAVRERIANFGPHTTLNEIAEIRPGRSIGRTDMVADLGDGAIQIIDPRRLRAESLDEEEPEIRYVAQHADINPEDYLLPDDVLLPRMRTVATHASVFAGDFPAVAASSVYVLRPNEKTSPYLIAEFLNSAAGQRLLDSIVSGGSLPQIHLAGLRNLPIPLINLNLAAPLKDVEQAYDDLANAATELKSRKRELFDSPNPSVFTEKLQDLQRRTTLLSNSLRLADSLEFQISQLFPFPIAYGYRLLASYVNPRERYQEQLRVAENILAFLGSVSAALLTDDDRHSLTKYLRDCWQGGISPGDWCAIISRCSKMLKEYEDHPLAASLSKLHAGSDKKGIGKELHFLVETKNAFKHDRGPKTETDIINCSEKLQASLDGCMKILVFWTSHPVRQIREIDVERNSGRVRLQCLKVVGDHPGFRQDEIRWNQALTKGDLYVEAGDGFWVPLHPYIQRLTCHHCKAEETYFVDWWDGARNAKMKSFERGHTEESTSTAEDLAICLPKLPE